ncbi:MAG: type II secretion system F family protein [Deltaproteobacteria bacterium]|nr:type II secretion system F family protein [Deltaproteobacteria bacterium]
MDNYIIFLSILTAFSVFLALLSFFSNKKVVWFFKQKEAFWNKQSVNFKMPFLSLIPSIQLVGIVVFLLISPVNPLLLLLIFPLLLIPGLSVKKIDSNYKRLLNLQLDSMLSSLANALTVNANLQFALKDVAAGEREPMAGELKRVLKEVQLGQTIEDALIRFAKRSEINDLSTAVSQIIVGKKTGGDLSKILSVTAAGLREMTRLEGVVKNKTAEGKGQAWIIGLTPPFLVVLMQILDPSWMLPLWSNPLGWLILAICIFLEIASILIIKKILAVDI